MPAATINGEPCASLRVVVPSRGAWFADATMISEVDLSGLLTIAIGDLELVGTATSAGTRGEQSFARIAAGAGAWSTDLPAKAYHSDARIKAARVAEDAARESGETLEALTTTADLGIDYVRRAGPASRALDDALGGAWYVDVDGTTRAGTWPAAAAGEYVVVDVQPDIRRAIIETDDVRSVWPGVTLEDDLDVPIAVHEIEIEISEERARVVAWGGAVGDRIGNAVRAIVAREQSRRIWGLWRYRVSQMSGDRVELQAIARDAGLPDILPISMSPGVAGVHSSLALGGEVYVQFVEGDPRRPVVTHFGGKGSPGHAPTTTTIDASATILLGAGAAGFVALASAVDARLTSIQSTFDAHQHVETGTTTNVPTVPIGTLATTAAAKVKAE